jgi:hypothetical protein
MVFAHLDAIAGAAVQRGAIARARGGIADWVLQASYSRVSHLPQQRVVCRDLWGLAQWSSFPRHVAVGPPVPQELWDTQRRWIYPLEQQPAIDAFDPRTLPGRTRLRK